MSSAVVILHPYEQYRDIKTQISTTSDVPSAVKIIDEEAGSIFDVLLGHAKRHTIRVEMRHSAYIGTYVIAVIDGDARLALRLWLSIAERAHALGVPVFVKWTGETDVSPEELGEYVGRALARMGVFLSTEEPIDAVELVREVWSGG